MCNLPILGQVWSVNCDIYIRFQNFPGEDYLISYNVVQQSFLSFNKISYHIKYYQGERIGKAKLIGDDHILPRLLGKTPSCIFILVLYVMKT